MKQLCLVCEKGVLDEVDNICSDIEGYVFVEKGKRCTYCKEEFLGEKETQKMIDACRKLGIWGFR